MGAAIVPIALVASAAIAAAGTGYAAYSAYESSNAEAKQADAQEDTARAAAAQEEAQNRRRMMQTIAAQDALRAARGGSMTSSTALSIYGDTVDQYEQDIRTSKINTLSQADQYRMAARMRRGEASDAVVGGSLSVGSTLASGGAKAYSAYK